MKYIYFFFILLFSISFSTAQDDLEGEWYVHYISIDGEMRYTTLPNSENTAIFTPNENNIVIEGSVCDNGYGGFYEYNSENTLKLLSFNVLGGFCDYDVEQNYFLNPYFGTVGTIYEIELYSFEIVGNGINQTLQFTNPNGNYVLYGRTPLEQPDILGEWYLYSLESNGLNYPNIFNAGFNINFDLNSFDGNAVCNGYTGSYYMTGPNTFEILGITVTIAGCTPPEAYGYEFIYFDIIGSGNNEENKQFTIQIFGDGDDAMLVITNQFGNLASYSRTPLVDSSILGEWFLHSINTNGFNFIPNIYNPNFNINFTLEPDSIEGLQLNGTAICNDYFGNYSTPIENSLSIHSITPTLAECDNMIETNFENFYFNALGLSEDGSYNYSINDTGENTFMHITNQNGDQLKYGRQPLPIPDISGTWYLHSIFDTDLEIEIENEFNPNAFIEFTTDENGTTVFSGTAMCNTFSGNYLIALTPSIAISDFGSTDLDCDNDDANYFESLYLPMFYSDDGDSLIYIQVSNDEGNVQLNLYSINNGVWAYFGSEPLSNSEFVKTELTITKNPVKSYLEINRLSQFNLNYSIYSIDGKKVLDGLLKNNRINVQVLTNGLYFLKIDNKQIIKFIKR